MDTIRLVAARVAAALVAMFVAWVATKFGIVIDQQTAAAMETIFVAGVMLIVYALGHKFFNGLGLNKLDTASKTMVKPGMVEGAKAAAAASNPLEPFVKHGPNETYTAEELAAWRKAGGGVAPTDAPKIPKDGI